MQEQMNDIADKNDYIKRLEEVITPERIQKMRLVLKSRTRYITIVLEDIFQPHNASAVLRSCDCFGLLDVHIIENRNTYQVNPDVALGASRWLNLYKYHNKEENTTACLKKLKEQGYRLVAASPHKEDCPLEKLPLDQKTALIFGKEKEGLSTIAVEKADAFVHIPMVGFTESLNISVSVAVCLYSLTMKMRGTKMQWQLGADEKQDTLICWMEQCIRKPEQFRKAYIQSLSK